MNCDKNAKAGCPDLFNLFGPEDKLLPTPPKFVKDSGAKFAGGGRGRGGRGQAQRPWSSSAAAAAGGVTFAAADAELQRKSRGSGGARAGSGGWVTRKVSGKASGKASGRVSLFGRRLKEISSKEMRAREIASRDAEIYTLGALHRYTAAPLLGLYNARRDAGAFALPSWQVHVHVHVHMYMYIYYHRGRCMCTAHVHRARACMHVHGPGSPAPSVR